MGENTGENGRSEALGENTVKTAGNNEMCNCNAKKENNKIFQFYVFTVRNRISLVLQGETWK